MSRNGSKFITTVHTDDEFKNYIKKVLFNHMLLYNLGLEYISSNPNFNPKKKKEHIKDYIVKHNIQEVILESLAMELHYQNKKVKSGNYKEKLLTDIQYLTFTDNSISIDLDSHELFIKDIPGRAFIVDDIDKEIYLKRKYINLSYSSNKDKFELKLF